MVMDNFQAQLPSKSSEHFLNWKSGCNFSEFRLHFSKYSFASIIAKTLNKVNALPNQKFLQFFFF